MNDLMPPHSFIFLTVEQLSVFYEFGDGSRLDSFTLYNKKNSHMVLGTWLILLASLNKILTCSQVHIVSGTRASPHVSFCFRFCYGITVLTDLIRIETLSLPL